MSVGDEVRPFVLILTDSLAFVGPRMAHPVDDPRLWPNVMARALDADVEIFGDFGWTARDAWFALENDVCLWPVMCRADVVVLAVGSFDSAPQPLPSSLWKRIAMIRSPKMRRVMSAAHRRAVPLMAKVFSYLPGGGPVVLRPKLTTHFLRESVMLLRQGRDCVPVVGMTPIVGRAKVYAGVHKGRAKAERAMRKWAVGAEIPLLDMAATVGDHMMSGRGNPDGMHMGWEGHTAVGVAFADLLTGTLAVRSATTGAPREEHDRFVGSPPRA